jgi:hypothetical protein
MLHSERPRIQACYRHRLAKVLKEGNRVTGLVAADLASGGDSVAVSGKVFIDATYEGDVAAVAGVSYRVGREGHDEYGEKHAGLRYTLLSKNELLPGSSGKGDAGIQAYNFRFCLTDRSENRLPVVKPDGYDRRDYGFLLADIRAGRVQTFRQAVQLHPVPNGKVDINNNHTSDEKRGPSESTDLAEENWSYPDASDAERKRIFDRTLSYGLGLIWFLQNDSDVPEGFRTEASRWGLCKDEFISNRHLPRQMYVREARRIFGEYVLTERDGELAPGFQRPRPQPTSIAVATYGFDCHAVHKYDPAHPGVREGYFLAGHPPLQVPFGVLVPRTVDGLLVPVCCSASHVGYQTLRMEPLYMTLGQAAGTAASLAVRQKVRVRDVPIETLQRELIAQKGVITYYDDVPIDHPAFGALQFLGARGLTGDFHAAPDSKLTRRQGAEAFARLCKSESITWTAPTDRLEEPLLTREVEGWLRQVGWSPKAGASATPADQQLRVADFAGLIDQAYLGAKGKIK